MLAVTGFRTTIVRALATLVDGPIVRIAADLAVLDCAFEIPAVDRFVLAAGVLVGKRLSEQTPDEIGRGLAVNAVNVARLCDAILDARPKARICVIGSESGIRGSHDAVYAMSKAAVHQYVETRRTGRDQQLVAVAPHIILDSGMTRRRHDFAALVDDVEHGKRFIRARDVAQCVRFLLWDGRWINNQVIRMAREC